MTNGIDLSTAEAVAAFIADNIDERLHDERIDGRCVPFEEEGVLTSNAGFTLRTAEGAFQITIVRTRR